MRGAADDNRRLRSLQRNYHFALKLGRREDRHLVEARRIGTVAKEIERWLIGEIENRSATAAEIGHEIAHLIDAMSNLHGAGIDPSDPADAAKVVRGVVEPDVGDIGYPQGDEEKRQERDGGHRPRGAPEKDEQNQNHRADQKRREILMLEIGAA